MSAEPVAPEPATEGPLVVVTLGTDHHPFTRLVAWVDEWAGANPDVPCFIQYGTAPRPAHADGEAVLGVHDLHGRLATAQVVVGHAGPGTIQLALGLGIVPIIVARKASLGEVVDDHQLPFGQLMHDTGRALLVHDRDALHQALSEAVDHPRRMSVHPSITAGADAAIARVGELIDGLLAR